MVGQNESGSDEGERVLFLRANTSSKGVFANAGKRGTVRKRRDEFWGMDDGAGYGSG